MINSPTALFEMTWPSMAGGSKNQTGITKIRNLGSKTNQTRHQKQNIKSPGGYTQDHKFSGHTKIKQGSTQSRTRKRGARSKLLVVAVVLAAIVAIPLIIYLKHAPSLGDSASSSSYNVPLHLVGDANSSYILNTPPELAIPVHHTS